MSLVEVVIAASISVVVLAGPLALFQGQWKNFTNSKLQGEAFGIIHEIRSILSVPSQCLINYQGVNLSTGPQGPKGTPPQIASSNAGISPFVIGTPRTGEQTKVISANLSPMVPYDSSNPSEGTSQFQLQLQLPDNRVTSWSVPMSVQLDATGAIQGCRAGSWFQPMWQYNNGALTFPGSVGIGTTAAANQPLTVNGTLFYNMGWQPNPMGPSSLVANAFDIIEGAGDCFSIFGYTSLYLNGATLGYWTNGAPFDSNLEIGYGTTSFGTGLHLEGSSSTQTWDINIQGNQPTTLPDQVNSGIRIAPFQSSQNLLVHSKLVVGNILSQPNDDFYVDGNAGGMTTFNIGSDAHSKEKIRDLSDPSSFVDQLRPVSFRFKNTGRLSIGFIAQEVKKVLPPEFSDLISAKEPYWSMSYSEMIPILVKTLQAIREKNRSLKHDQARIIEALCAKYPEEEGCHAKDP